MIGKGIDGNEYEVTIDDLTWWPSTFGVVISVGKILLAKEKNGYHLPGGSVYIGEDPKLAVLREVKEETGAIVSNPQLLDSKVHYSD